MEKEKILPEGDLEARLKPEVESVYAEMIEMPEAEEALKILNNLPADLKYHAKEHTLDVIRETILFALADEADRNVLRQQVISAAWHDTGYTINRENNEKDAVALFRDSQAYQNLSEEERNEIIANILDTQIIVQDGEPRLLKQRSQFGYALDADGGNFGRTDFFEKKMLFEEELGISPSDIERRKKFLEFTIKLLKNHEWKTESARSLRQAQKEKNLADLEKEYKSLFH